MYIKIFFSLFSFLFTLSSFLFRLFSFLFCLFSFLFPLFSFLFSLFSVLFCLSLKSVYTRSSPAGHGGPAGNHPDLISTSCTRKFSNHSLRIPEFAFGQLQSFCGTLNQPGYSLGSFLNDLNPPELPDPRFPDSRFCLFLISVRRNGPGWYISLGRPLIKHFFYFLSMYSHLPKNFFWSESECTSLI